MELSSPNLDPYSSWQKAKSNLADAGFEEPLKVMEDHLAKGTNGEVYKPENLSIHKGYRFLEQDSYLSPSNGEMVPKYLLAVQAEDEQRYYIEFFFNSPYQDTVLNFMNSIEADGPNRKFLNWN